MQYTSLSLSLMAFLHHHQPETLRCTLGHPPPPSALGGAHCSTLPCGNFTSKRSRSRWMKADFPALAAPTTNLGTPGDPWGPLGGTLGSYAEPGVKYMGIL